MKEAGVKPEMECFDVGHIESSRRSIDMGVIDAPFQFSFIHGRARRHPRDARNLAPWPSRFRPARTWKVIGISREQWKLVCAALSLGGNVRVGFEDNFYLPNGEMAKSNGELVEAAAEIVRCQGRERGRAGRGPRRLLSPPAPDRSGITG